MPKAPKQPPGELALAVAAILRTQMGFLDNMSKSELARRSGVERTMTSDIVRGLTTPDIEQLDLLCQALRLNLTKTIKKAEDATEARVLRN